MSDINIYDYVAVSTVEEGDCIYHDDDYLEVSRKVDDGAIFIAGYSHITGDTAQYTLDPDTEVGLWTV